jgi:uncharacterized protein (TIGR02246 family)
MRRSLPIVGLVCMALLTPSLVFGEESVEAAIRARVKQYETAYNAGDVEALARIYAADATHTYALGVTHRGRPEIASGLKDMFAGPFKNTRMEVTPLHIRPLSADVAIEEASFVLTGLKNADGTESPPVNGFCLAIYQKQGEEWFVAAIQCMVPPPPAPPK